MKSQCRASGCKNAPMEHGFCGVHDEMLEDGEHFQLKPLPNANKQQLGKRDEQRAKAKEAIHEVLAEAKARREARAKR